MIPLRYSIPAATNAATYSEQHGYWPTYEACKEFIEKGWGPDVQYVVNIWT